METREVEMASIHVSDANVRKDLEAGTEDTDIDDLATSIKKQGLLSPITVLERADGDYDLIIGQRRYMACKSLGWDMIPAIVRDTMEETDAVVLSLVENVHRADVSPMDKARAYQKIYEKVGTYKDVAKETGVSASTVSKYMSLLDLAPEIQERASTSSGSAGVGTLSRLARTFDSPDDQKRALDAIGGFKSDIQKEILKRSEGDAEKLHELKNQAVEGAFDTHLCRGIDDCAFIPEEVIPLVKDIVDQYESTGKVDLEGISESGKS